MKRSQEKRITQNAVIIRYMRHLSGLSLSEAGRRVRITGSAIAHMEHGRMDISRERLRTLVQAYGFSMVDYLEYVDGKAVPVIYRDECIAIIRNLNETKLKAVHSLLSAFLPEDHSA